MSSWLYELAEGPADTVPKIISALPAISGNKEDRRVSVDILLGAPTEAVSNHLAEIATKKGRMQASDYGLALQWTDAVISHLKKEDAKPDLLVKLLTTQGILLSSSLASTYESKKGAQSAFRMRRTLVYHSRQAVLKLSNELRAEIQFDTLFKALLAQGLPGLLELGLIISTLHEPTPSFVTASDLDEAAIAKFWCDVVLLAKQQDFVAQVVPILDSQALDAIWTITSQSTFDTVVVESLNKALLRAPEGAVKHVIPSILRSQSSLVLDKLAASPSLVSNLSSSNSDLRHATASTFGAILDKTTAPDLEGLLTQFKRVTNSDQRALFASVLQHVPHNDDTTKVASVLATQAAKEATEASVQVLADALVPLVPNEEAVAAIKKGISDQRKPLKREWILSVAQKANPEIASKYFGAELHAVWKEITDNITGAATSKLAPASFGLVVLLPDLAEIPEQLFSSRVVDHANSDRELRLMSFSCARMILDRGSSSELVLRAFVHSVIAGSPMMKVQNLKLFKEVFSVIEISSTQPQTLVQVLSALDLNVARLVSSIASKEWMIDAFILAQQPLAMPKGGWIQMCLNSGIDPNQLVNENLEQLFSSAVEAHSVLGLSTLAFVAPEVVASRLKTFFNSHLVGESMSEKDIAILAAPEGQLVKPGAQPSSRNNTSKKNLSDDAWEAELRKELAEKHGKMSEQDQQELSEQTKRRHELQEIAKRVEFCCALLIKLAEDATGGAENGILQWIPDALMKCLDIIKGRVPGRDSAEHCLSSLSMCLSDRFKGTWKKRTAELVLKGKNVEFSSVSSMLYMLNPVSDKRLLDTLSLVYILPILQTVLSEYRGDTEDEEADETVLLVTSLLANQAEVLAKIPRGELVSVLLDLLAKFAADRHVVKDCLRSMAQRIEFTNSELGMLLDASIAAPQEFVKASALDIIDAEVDLSGFDFCPEIWISRFGQFGEVAQEIWDESNMAPTDNILDTLLSFFRSQYSSERAALARSYAAAALVSKSVSAAYAKLANLYVECKQPPKPEFNSFGLEVKKKWIDPVPERLNILAALQELVQYLSQEDVVKCAKLVVDEGVTDRAHEAANAALDLGKSLIDSHGQKFVDDLLPIFDTSNHIILFGFAAQHLPSSDPRLISTVQKLLAALPTADDSNSNVIIGSISPLAPRIDYQPVMAATLEEAFAASTLEARRGAAFGFAGLARGVGLSALGDLSIVNALSGAVDDKKDANRREGAQWLVHALAQAYGPLFEPYAIELMPQVLAGLGDGVPAVRDAANEAAKSIMSFTSSYGIKKQIPMALEQLDDTSWRGKKGAVELLGSMAYLSPQQLASSLATIVPEIASLLNYSHKEVRSSAKRSMKMFGNVIVNPEIHKLVPVLLGAISDPTTKTDEALTELLKTRFMHYIDSPSLALIIFVVQRGLRDRSANIKHKSCQIVGNMSILTAGRDIIPYLPAIMPDLQVAMTDPVQQTSAVACKALGVLVEKLGEEYFPNVIPDLLDKLKTDDPKEYGNRWGTAQGLAEVLHGLGTAKLDEVLPDIVANCQSPINHIRQGFAPLLLLLPGSFGPSLTPYLSQLVPPLLRGLADQLEDVRDHSLKAGRRIVRGYATIAVDLLLPELEQGLWNPSWRIRLASVELVGDLLLELLGKGDSNSVADRMKALAIAPGNESDGNAAEGEAREAEAVRDEATQEGNYVETNLRNLEVLGTARRDRVLSAIFVCRADVVGTVRQAALDTWLAIIQNTPRAVKLILPTLVVMLVRRLGDEDEELQTNAARALAELVRRVSGALKLILPTFVEHLPDRDARQGICLGLVELIPATPVASLQEHERDLMHLVRSCLQDTSNAVRESATRALEELHAALGDVAGDMLPEMVDQVVSANDEGALAAIKEMLASTGASSVLAAAIPPLLKSNLDEFHAQAVAELCLSASPADISPYVQDVVDALIRTDHLEALDSVLGHSCPEAHMLSLVKNDEQLRSRVLGRMASYYANVEHVDPLFVSDWMVFALHGLEAADSAVSAEALLRAITSSSALTKSDLAKLVTPAFQTLQQLSVPIKPFAESAKGPAFVLPFFLQGLALGSNLEKEQSALAIAEIVRRTVPAESLKPVVTQITGPLIRIVGERTAPDVKASIIYTLNELLMTIPAFLKPFLPQLQRTFAKNLADGSSSVVRTRAAMALGTLIKLQTRIDPLAKEIIGGVRTAPDSGVRHAFLSALFEIVNHAGANLGAPLREAVVELVGDLDQILGDEANKDLKQMTLFAKIGACVVALPDGDHRKMIDSLLTPRTKLQSVLNANALLVYAAEQSALVVNDVEQLLEAAAKNSSPVFSENGIAGLGKLLLTRDSAGQESLKPFEQQAISALTQLVSATETHSHEARRLCIVVLGALPAHHGTPAVLQAYRDELAPTLFSAARDRNIPIKLAAEASFRALFDFAARQDSVLFDEWFAGAKDQLDQRMQRSLPEYVRRVAMRAATRETEENEEPVDDELKEIWAIGVE